MPRKARTYTKWIATAAFAAVLVTGVIAVAWTWSQPFEGCAIQSLTEGTKRAIDQYSESVKNLLTLSTGLAALGGALLLGLREGPKLTETRRILLLTSTSCFAFSAYFALVWQSWLAELHLAECPSLITHRVMRFPFIAHTNFFVLGLAFIGLLALSAAFEPSSQVERNDEQPRH